MYAGRVNSKWVLLSKCTHFSVNASFHKQIGKVDKTLFVDITSGSSSFTWARHIYYDISNNYYWNKLEAVVVFTVEI